MQPIEKVIVIGSLNRDMFIRVPHIPAKGENVHAVDVQYSLGGKGANQAAQCARLGLNTFMCGCVGQDDAGSCLIEGLQKSGVDTSFVRAADAPTGMGVVFTSEGGELAGAVIKGANWALAKSDVDSVLHLFGPRAAVVLQMEVPIDVVEYAIEKAHERGCRIFLNAAPATSIDMKYFSLLSYAVFNETEAAFYLKENARLSTVEGALEAVKAFSGEVGCGCVFTLGPAGAVCCSDGVALYSPSIDVPVVETTGAGDSFIGGFIYCISKGAGLKEALDFASLCSAYTIGRVGAQEAMPRLGDLDLS